MSERDVIMLLAGIVCGGTAVGGMMLATLRPSMEREMQAANPKPLQQPRADGRSNQGNLEYAMDGYCPVTLVDKYAWKLGNIEYRERERK